MLTPPAVAALRTFVRRYRGSTDVPTLGAWKDMDPDTLWLKVVTQVAVVGNSASAATINRSADARRSLGLDGLAALSPDEAAVTI
jgi:hypothetical protein